MKNIRNVFLLIISAIILLFASCDRPHDNDASHVHTVVMDEAVEPKCTVDGLTEGSHCSACNEIIVAQQNIPSLGHTAITDEAIPPSCISVGYTEGSHCSECGEILLAKNEIEKVGCNISWVTEIAPTKTEDGLRNYKCRVCGEIYDSKILYAGSQSLMYVQNEDGTYTVSEIRIGQDRDSDIVIPRMYNDKPVTGIGSNALVSSVTSLTIHEGITHIAEDAFEITAFSSSMAVCEFIVALENPNYSSIDGALFTKDGKTLLKYPIGNKRTVYYVPDGVTDIASNAFAFAKNLTEIYFSNSVMRIGDAVFSDCYSLVSVSFSDTLADIGTGIFYYCTALESIVFPNSLENIGQSTFMYCQSLKSVALPENMTAIPNFMFWGCGELSSIEIPDTVMSIGDQAFLACYSLSSPVLPEGLVSIGSSAFEFCNSITQINIPKGLEYIGNYAFYECRGMKNYVVDPEHAFLESIDGNLYLKDESTLLYYAIGKEDKEFTVPNGTLRIAENAFYYCEALEKIIIPDSIVEIGGNAFKYCRALKYAIIGSGVTIIPESAFDHSALIEISIPKSLTEIGSYAFNWCGELTTISFGGTVEEWLAITKKSHFDDLTPNYTVYCTDGKVDKNGNNLE